MDEVLGQRPSIAPPVLIGGHTGAKCRCGWPGGGGGWGWWRGGGGGGRKSARAVQKAEEGGRTRLPHQGGHEAPERGRGEAGARERSLHGEAAGENAGSLSLFFFLYCYILKFHYNLRVLFIFNDCSYDFIFHTLKYVLVTPCRFHFIFTA